MPHPFGPPQPGSVHTAPSYIESGASSTQEDVDDVQITPVDRATKQNNLFGSVDAINAIIEDTPPNADRYENAGQVAKETIESGVIALPGWTPPGGDVDLTGRSRTSSSTSSSTQSGSGGMPGSGLLSSITGAGGAMIAIVVGIAGALIWSVNRDG